MSAAFAVFLLLSLGGIGFLVWFFIALCKEARKRRVRSVRRAGLNLYKVRPTPCDPALVIMERQKARVANGGIAALARLVTLAFR
jgi:hypothetical protein